MSLHYTYTLPALAKYFRDIPPSVFYMVVGGVFGRQLPLEQHTHTIPVDEVLSLALVDTIYRRSALEPLRSPDPLLLALRLAQPLNRLAFQDNPRPVPSLTLAADRFLQVPGSCEMIDIVTGKRCGYDDAMLVSIASIDLYRLRLLTEKGLENAARQAKQGLVTTTDLV